MHRAKSPEFDDFYGLVRESHHLPPEMPFTISYIDPRNGDLLPITNDHNLLRAFSTALPLLKILVFRKQGSYAIVIANDSPIMFINFSKQLYLQP